MSTIGHVIEGAGAAGLACGLAIFAQGAVPELPSSMPTTIGGAFITISVMMTGLVVWIMKRKFDENDKDRESRMAVVDRVLASHVAAIDKVIAAFAAAQKDGHDHDEKELEQFAALADRNRSQQESAHKDVVAKLDLIIEHVRHQRHT